MANGTGAPTGSTGSGGSQATLEEMVVRFTSDVQGYLKGMNDVQAKTVESTNSVEHLSHKIDSAADHIKEFGETAAKALGAIGIGFELRGMFEKFEEFEKNQIKLNALIESGGHNVRETSKEYGAFASEMANTTLMTKGQTYATLQQAEMMGKSGKEAVALAKTAASLAAVMGGEAGHFIRAAKAMEEGDTQILRFQLRLRGAHDESEIFRLAQLRVVAGQKILREEAETTGGRIERLGRTFNGLQREMGGMIAEGISPTISKLEGLAQAYTSLSPGTKSAIAESLVFTSASVAAVAGVSSLISILKSAASGWTLYAAAIAAVVTVTYEFSPPVRKLAEDAEESQKALQRLSKEIDENTTKNLQQALSMPEGQRAEFLAGPMEEAKGRVENYRKELERLEEQNKRYEGVGGFLLAHFGPDEGDNAAILERQIKEQKKMLDEATAAAERYKKALEPPPRAFMEAKIATDVDKLEKSLGKAVSTFGLGHDEAARFNLVAEGASEAQLKIVDNYIEQHKQQQINKKDMEEAAKLTHEFASPADKLAEKLDHLNYQFFEVGEISVETYKNAIKKAEDEFDAAEKKAAHLDHAVGHLNATLANTPEAAAGLQEYVDKLAEQLPTTRAEVMQKQFMALPASVYGSEAEAFQQPDTPQEAYEKGLFGLTGLREGGGGDTNAFSEYAESQKRTNELLGQVVDNTKDNPNKVVLESASLE